MRARGEKKGLGAREIMSRILSGNQEKQESLFGRSLFFVGRLVVGLWAFLAVQGVCLAEGEMTPSMPWLIVKSGRVGFIESNGKILVMPRYASCGRWSEGRLWVQEHTDIDSWGLFIDEQAKPVSPLRFHNLYSVRPERPMPCFEKGVAVIGMPGGGFGYLNAAGLILAETTPAGAFQRQEGELLLCVVNNRIGFIDRTGRTVVPARYDEATPFRSGRAGVRQGILWGLIDGKGDWVAEPAFERLRPVSEDARIWSYREGGRSGLIDRDGKRLTDAIYLDVGFFSGGAIPVQNSTGWGLLAEDGTVLVKPQYANLGSFGTDASLWSAQSPAAKWGVVSTNGQERVPCSFDFVVAASAKIWLAQQSGLWGILDPRTGQWRLPATFNRILPLELPFTNRALVEQSGRWGVVDGETGQELIETRGDRIAQWGAFIAVEKGGNMQLLDVNLQEVESWEGTFEGLPEYATMTGDSGVLYTTRGATRITRDGKRPWRDCFEDAGEWSGGFLAVKRNGLWGLVNEAGESILNPKFQSVMSVSEGVAPVCEEGRWSLIWLNGHTNEGFFMTEAETMGRSWKGLVPIRRTGFWGLIDFAGKDVLPCEYDAIEWGFDDAGTPLYYGAD